ncbi:MAG: hypothetical protein ACOCX1_02275, partial [Fimbriimonadaceae bacterium]
HGSLLLGAAALLVLGYVWIGPSMSAEVTGQDQEPQPVLTSSDDDEGEVRETSNRPQVRTYTPPEVSIDVTGPPVEESEPVDEEVPVESVENPAPEPVEEEPAEDDPIVITPSDDPVPPAPQIPEGEEADPGSAGGIDPGDAFEVGPGEDNE